MDGIKNPLGLQIITNNHSKKRVNGMKILKLNNIHSVWSWSEDEILIHETTILSAEQETPASKSSQSGKMSCRNVFTLETKVIDVFYWSGEVAYALVESGIIHSFLSSVPSMKSPSQFMDVDDMFCSPPNNPSLTWVQNSVPVMKVADCCDNVISACQLTAGIAVLAIKNEQLMIFVFSYPDFNLQVLLDLDKYTPYIGPDTLKGEVVSSCSIALLTPLLKQLLFQEDSHGFDSELVIIGLTSGLCIWFCVGSPINGPFVLCSLHQQVQGIHWIKDDVSGLLCNLLIVLCSGRVVIFGEKENVTVCLPDSVKTSCLFKNYLVTSNLYDCYSIILHLKKEISSSCFLLPVKGVCAVALSPDLDTLVVATVHGSLYSLDPTATSSDTFPHFVIPDQSLLDNMFIHTQTLENIYLEMSKEDGIMTALSVTAAVNNIQNTFEIQIKVVSGAEFAISAKLLKTNMVFTHNLWLACIEISSGKGERETLLCSLKEDFSRSRDLSLNVTRSLSIGTVVSLELVLFLGKQLPLVSVLLDKVEIDASHLMSSNVISPNMTCFQKSLDGFLYSHKELQNKPLKEFERAMKIPHYFNIDSALMTVLKDSQHRILGDWSNTSGGNKRSIQVCVMATPVQFNLNLDSKELTITCCNVQLCNQIKESILKRLTTSEEKYITENITMDIQALYQTYEVEQLKDKPNISVMDSLWKRLRVAVSSQLPV